MTGMPRGLNGREDPYGESAGSALLDAINRSKVHLARFILDANDEDTLTVVNTRDFKGKTPLIRSVYITEEKSRQRAMNLLLQRGADPNLQDDYGRTALSYACELRHNDVVKLLMKWNIDPDLPDAQGNTPLMYCAAVGNDTAVGILLKCFRRLGLAVDRENTEGFSALHIAAKNGFTECAARLAIEGHASVTQPDRNFGRTAEQWARAQGCATPEVALFSTAAQKLRRPRTNLRVYSRPSAYPSSKTSPTRTAAPRCHHNVSRNPSVGLDGSTTVVGATAAATATASSSRGAPARYPHSPRARPRPLPAVELQLSPSRSQFTPKAVSPGPPAARQRPSKLKRTRTQPNVSTEEEAEAEAEADEEQQLNESFISSVTLSDESLNGGRLPGAEGRVLSRQRAQPMQLQISSARRQPQNSSSSVNTASRIDLEFETDSSRY